MGETRVTVADLHDDAEVLRMPDGDAQVIVSTWLHPAQVPVVLSWASRLLRAEPMSVAMHATVRAGQVAARAPDVAARRLVELMDRSRLSPAEQADAIELVLR